MCLKCKLLSGIRCFRNRFLILFFVCCSGRWLWMLLKCWLEKKGDIWWLKFLLVLGKCFFIWFLVLLLFVKSKKCWWWVLLMWYCRIRFIVKIYCCWKRLFLILNLLLFLGVGVMFVCVIWWRLLVLNLCNRICWCFLMMNWCWIIRKSKNVVWSWRVILIFINGMVCVIILILL